MIAFDTNILIYSVSVDDIAGRHIDALRLITAAAPVGAIVPLSVVGEFLNVCRKKKTISFDHAIRRVDEFLGAFTCPESQATDLIDAFVLAERTQLQYFDALVITVAARAGATILLSEDMQDGLQVDGLQIVNPFAAANENLLAEFFGSVS